MAGASKKALADLSDEDLDARAQDLMAARAEAEEGFKADQLAIRQERDRRATAAQVAALSDTERDALRAALGEG